MNDLYWRYVIISNVAMKTFLVVEPIHKYRYRRNLLFHFCLYPMRVGLATCIFPLRPFLSLTISTYTLHDFQISSLISFIHFSLVYPFPLLIFFYSCFIHFLKYLVTTRLHPTRPNHFNQFSLVFPSMSVTPKLVHSFLILSGLVTHTHPCLIFSFL